MSKEDQRVALTKRLLSEGLFRLLKKYELEKISVTELCNESGINRATFYRHYEQPRDILIEIRNNMFFDLTKIAENAFNDNNIYKWLEESCQYYYDNAEVSKILLSCKGDNGFVEFINRQYQDHFKYFRQVGFGTNLDDDNLKLATYFYAAGIFYILKQWLTEPINKTPKEVAELMYKFF